MWNKNAQQESGEEMEFVDATAAEITCKRAMN